MGGELDTTSEEGFEEGDFEEINIKEEDEEKPEGYYRSDPDDEETKYSEKFGSVPGPGLGCFGTIVMYFVHKKQVKARQNHRSLISRNQRFKRGVNQSMRKLKERTMSMMSIASTNFKSSKMHLAESMTNLSKSLPSRSRHMSMQDRLEMYNEELDTDNDHAQPRVRKVSKVAFEPPTPAELGTSSPPVTTTHMPVPPTTRTRKVSKISMFEFVPEEQEKEKQKDRPNSADIPQPIIC